MSKLLKVAVTGAGHLGKWQADIYAANADCELGAVVGPDLGKARAIAHQFTDIAGAAAAYCDYREVIPLVDAISLVVPTSLQYKIAREILEAGIHCREEKPPSATAADASALLDIAKQRGLSLQAGLSGRCNSVMTGIEKYICKLLFLLSTRLASVNLRASAVSVIAIIPDLLEGPLKQISARGRPVLANGIDIADAIAI